MGVTSLGWRTWGRRWLPLVAAVVVAMAPAAARATTLLEMTVEQTVEVADAVVRGTVVERTPGVHRDGQGNQFIVTFITVAVEHAYIGEGLPDRVRYVIPGGTAPNGDTVSVPSGFPDEAVGAHVLLMLEEVPIEKTYAVTGAAQGRYYVTETSDGRATASRMPVEARFVDRATGQESTAAGTGALMPLEQLEKRIAAVADRTGRSFHADAPPQPRPLPSPAGPEPPSTTDTASQEPAKASKSAVASSEVANQ